MACVSPSAWFIFFVLFRFENLFFEISFERKVSGFFVSDGLYHWEFVFVGSLCLRIEIRNLSKTYPNGVQALKKIDLNLPEGRFVSIVGLSGSGKSTLIRCLNRIHEPTSGEIFLNGENILNLSPSPLHKLRQNIGMIFQDFNLIKRRTVLENVLMGRLGHLGNHWWPTLWGKWPLGWREEALSSLKDVGLASKASIRADALSGGQQQRVAIARVLFQKPRMLLADEPVASLDPATGHGIMEDLKKINQQQGVTVLCNLHFLSLIHEFSDHVVALKQGRVVYEGDATGLTSQRCQEIYGADARMDYR